MSETFFPGGPLHEKFLNALFITECGICGNPLDSHGICDACSAALEFAEAKSPLFEISSEDINVRCATCFVYDENTVTNLLFALKKNGTHALVNYAALRMKGAVSLLSPSGKALFTSVPRSTSGKMKYGFDQAELIAKRAARMCGVRYTKLIKQNGFSKEQKKLNAKQRKRNIVGRFKVRKLLSATAPDSIIIFDDVITTGSSIKECARLLHSKYPSTSLYAAVLATRQLTKIIY